MFFICLLIREKRDFVSGGAAAGVAGMVEVSSIFILTSNHIQLFVFICYIILFIIITHYFHSFFSSGLWCSHWRSAV